MKKNKVVSSCLQNNKCFVSFANMGHGEAIFIEHNDNMFIRDFGTSKKDGSKCNPQRILSQKKCQLQKYFTNEYSPQCSAILSHAHSDHFSGFAELYNKSVSNKPYFKFSYLPRLCTNEAEWQEAVFWIETAVCIYSFSNRIRLQDDGAYFLTAAPILASMTIPENLCFCSANQQEIQNKEDTDFYVLWPIVSVIGDRRKRKNSITPQERLKRFYSKKAINEKNQKKIEDATKKISQLLKPYSGIDPNYTNCVQKAECSHDIVIKRIYDIILNLKQEIQKNQKTIPVSDLYSHFKSMLDNGSLIFDIRKSFDSNSNEQIWLFLGDNEKSVVNRINSFAQKYYGIKAAHHGTRSGEALNAKKIHADFVICCTGPGYEGLSPIQQEYIALSLTKQCYALDKYTNMGKVNCIQKPFVFFDYPNNSF